MSYLIESYLDFLDNQILYEYMYLERALKYLNEQTPLNPAEISSHLAKNAEYLKGLIAQKARFSHMPEVVKKINAKIAGAEQTKDMLTKAKTSALTSPRNAPVPGGEVTPPPATANTPVPSGTVKPPAPEVTANTPVPGGDVSKVGQLQQAAKDTGEKVVAGAKEAGEKAVQGAKTAGQTVSQKVGAADTAIKQKMAGTDVGQQALGKMQDVAGNISQPAAQLPTGVAGPPAPPIAGTGAAGAAQTAAQKVGASPETAAGLGGAVKAVAASPLGMAALGGAAAFGGYKLYKRFLSKSARACRGYSGSQKTACMKSYMDAKKGQVSSRGPEGAEAY